MSTEPGIPEGSINLDELSTPSITLKVAAILQAEKQDQCIDYPLGFFFKKYCPADNISKYIHR